MSAIITDRNQKSGIAILAWSGIECISLTLISQEYFHLSFGCFLQKCPDFFIESTFSCYHKVLMPIITLLTDFGIQDGYPAAMKGVILSIASDVHIVDLTHDIPPQDVLQGALTLRRLAPYFPPGTIHVGVVDPGVGTIRRPIAAHLGEHFFVGPDNGLVSLLITKLEAHSIPIRFVHLDREEYWLPQVSRSFHGRDVFAPVAAHLARGVPLEQLGSPIEDLVRLDAPLPERLENGWRAQVLHIDRFGNLALNLTEGEVGPTRSLRVLVGGIEIDGLSQAYGDRPTGELVALFDSSGCLSVALVNGDAASRLQVTVGDPVEVFFKDAGPDT